MRVLRNRGWGVFCGACLCLAGCSSKADEDTKERGNTAGSDAGGTSDAEAGRAGGGGTLAGEAGSDAGGTAGDGGSSDSNGTLAGGGGAEGGALGDAGAGTAGSDGNDDTEADECAPCSRGCAMGDPHIVTFDGTYYDFQAAGEFILSKSEGYEVQARLEATELCDSAAVVKAIALDSDETGVTIHADADEFIRLGDGRSFPAGDIELMLDDWSFEWQCDGLLATKATGDAVFVTLLDGVWLDVEVRPAAASREAGVFGLLGDVDGDAENDIALPDGTELEIPVAWSTLYGSYADAWRVSEETSLFVYGEDESVVDYAGAGIPGVIALELADPDELSAAERICGDVQELSLYSGCLVDIMCGGADPQAAAKWYLTDVEPDNFLTVTPPNSITSFSSGPVSCADSGDASVVLSDTLDLGVISGCNYYQDAHELYLYFGRVDDHDDPIGSSYMAVQIMDFTGTGTYSTDASTTGTLVSVTSDEGTCSASSGLEDNACGAEPGLCTIEVLDTNVTELALEGSNRVDGVVRFSVACGSEFYRACGPDDELITAGFENLSLSGDVINCEVGR